MKRFLISLMIIITLFTLAAPICNAQTVEIDGMEIEFDTDFKEQVKKEKGSLFEKIIAECIAGIAQVVYESSIDLDVGFLDYDALIFNRGIRNSEMAPFNNITWKITMNWYKIFLILAYFLILIAITVVGYKFITSGSNVSRKNDAKESLMRLASGALALALAPLFIRFLLFLNNGFIKILGSSDALLLYRLGPGMFTEIETGSAVTTAIIIAIFVYLFIKINIKFIIRQFTIIVFTAFTPFAIGLWMINKNVTAASIWIGQIVMNIFMQFVYCFLFRLYISFVSSGNGWMVQIVWAMMIMPLADVLLNCFQNLTSRIAGLDNEQASNRVMGAGAMLSYSFGAIKEQFKTPKQNVNGKDVSESTTTGLKGFFNRAKTVISPSMNLSDEKDYNGNINPIRNNLPKEKNIPSSNGENSQKLSKGTHPIIHTVGKVASTGAKATKAYLDMGASLAEGDYSRYRFRRTDKKTETYNNLKNNEYINRLNEEKNLGDKNEPK